MGHHVQAFIDSKATLEEVHRQLGASKVVRLAQGKFLLPVTDELFDTIPTINGGSAPKGFKLLTAKVLEFLKRSSVGTEIGYFETDYFGGARDQGSVFVKDGQTVFGPQRGPDWLSKAQQ